MPRTVHVMVLEGLPSTKHASKRLVVVDLKADDSCYCLIHPYALSTILTLLHIK